MAATAAPRKGKSWKKDSYSKNQAHVAYFCGPILFTAPHGLQVYRGGDHNGTKVRLHKREKYSTELALMCARGCQKHLGTEGSFVVWNMKTAVKQDTRNLDPNYLVDEQQPDSPWHQALHVFQERNAGTPIFHVDIHGKMDRKTNLDLDLGIVPMEEVWETHPHAGEDDVEAITDSLDEGFKKAIKGTGKFKKAQMKFGVETEPALHGYWGDDTVKTISHQSVVMGMPAVQLEIPFTMRKELCTNEKFFKRFIKAICVTYENVIVPMYAANVDRMLPISNCDYDVNESENVDIDEMLADILYLESRNTMEKQI